MCEGSGCKRERREGARSAMRYKYARRLRSGPANPPVSSCSGPMLLLRRRRVTCRHRSGVKKAVLVPGTRCQRACEIWGAGGATVVRTTRSTRASRLLPLLAHLQMRPDRGGPDRTPDRTLRLASPSYGR